ncbi:hypothetical protein PanWU01x14_095660 [Parasponia andersonii]|uniref:Uncharacterized protein n=1 Tax=Parasponia andersonii TaxID=3476 RepID=A0A2P5D530_PARAD|nr:hypothetical protein PanWU01x14_095660 [Parasponia andersonii]
MYDHIPSLDEQLINFQNKTKEEVTFYRSHIASLGSQYEFTSKYISDLEAYIGDKTTNLEPNLVCAQNNLRAAYQLEISVFLALEKVSSLYLYSLIKLVLLSLLDPSLFTRYQVGDHLGSILKVVPLLGSILIEMKSASKEQGPDCLLMAI